MKQFKVSSKEQGIKCIKLCQKLLPNATSSFLYKMLRKKNITLNGNKTDGSESLSAGDTLTFFFSDETYEKFHGCVRTETSSTKIIQHFNSSAIIFENEDVLFYNKPAGLLSQKAKPSDLSLNEILLAYVSKQEIDTLQKPSICNRLDRNTSGLVIFGKSYQGIASMNRMLKERTCEKYYHCIVSGIVKEEIHLKGYLVKNEKANKVRIYPNEIPNSSYIETHLRPIKSGTDLTLLEVHLITGKTHQIRVHMASIGHPIIGDLKYGGAEFAKQCKAKYGVSFQLLHAYRLVFPMDHTCIESLRGKTYIAEKPKYFINVENQIG